tara:strand:+ start:1022 stop:1882 length:861 start_codon:yes stop_codon:yes gene_type:complete
MSDLAEHIGYRKDRYKEADITNPALLGLATVEINPTELCNRTCSFCPRSDPSIYPNRKLHMTIETAENLSEQLYADGFSGDIHITGWGEPMLNPHILEIIKRFSKYFFTEMITNGDRLLSGKVPHHALTLHGLHSIIIDCYDGPEQTERMTELMSTFAGKLRIRNNYDTGDVNLLDLYNFNNRGGTLGKVKSMQRPCWMPMYKAFVDWDGGVGLCCNDWARKQTDFGNINHNTFSDIWMSRQFTDVRKQLLEGNRSNLSACSNCNTNGCKSGEGSANIWNENIHRI